MDFGSQSLACQANKQRKQGLQVAGERAIEAPPSASFCVVAHKAVLCVPHFFGEAASLK